MSPARVETTDGHVFFVPEGGLLSKQDGFEHLGKNERDNTNDVDVLGTKDGFNILSFFSRGEGMVKVKNGEGATFYPRRESWIGTKVEGDIYTLTQGTKVEAITGEEYENLTQK